MAPKTSDKELNNLIMKAEKQNKWRFKMGGNHIKGFSIDGKFTTTISQTPKTRAAYIKTRSIFKKSGVKDV